ncbi:MAG: Bax inhibitor-1/YccA family protein [Alphaproteobacteria bacterium]|nr:Bax inhibitor-1/YccA family protein [Alphaproteobacteria bacterium]
MLIDLSQNASEAKRANTNEVIKSTVQSVFNYMGIGLIITAIISYATAHSPMILNAIFGSPLKWLIMLAPFGFVVYMNAKFKTATKSQLKNAFWTFCFVMGLSLSSIFLAYTGVAIFRAFTVSACMFLSMSLYGYTTKKDLTSMGSFMVMGLFGLIISSLINIFLKSTAMDFVISVVGVAVFMGLTAWDVQKLKRTAIFSLTNPQETAKLGIMHALSLYLDFINLFLYILRFQNR